MYTSQYAVRIQKILKPTNAINTNLFPPRTLTILRLDLGIEHVHSKSQQLRIWTFVCCKVLMETG